MLATEIAGAEVRPAASDDKLIAAAKSGDVEAFGALFERYKNQVFTFARRSLARREDAEDVVQETFCRAWRSIGSFRGDSNFLAWLFRIAANLCADVGRSKERRTRPATEIGIESEDLENLEDRTGATGCDIITKKVVSDALLSLNMDHRMLVVLCDVHGFTYTEAAHILGCSPASAGVRLFRARKKLRKILSGFLDEVD